MNWRDIDFDEVEYRFDPNQIRMSIRQMSLFELLRRIDKGLINLKTSFQRLGNLWSLSQQSRLIESMILKIPIPTFYFDISDYDNWQIVDGLQRMYTVNNYIRESTFALKGLEFLPEFNGKKFHELPREIQRRIEETEVTVNFIEPGTPEEVKFVIFDRINTGGLRLKSQELRFALNQGIATDLINELSSERNFLRATNDSIPTKRMEDREFVNRFVAFYLFFANYDGNLNAFMNKSMREIAHLDNDSIQKIVQDFNKSMQLSYDIFGNSAFRNPTADKGKINKAIFDTVSVNLAWKDIRDVDFSRGKTFEEFRSGFQFLFKYDAKFVDSVTKHTNSKHKVEYRFDRINQLVTKYLR